MIIYKLKKIAEKIPYSYANYLRFIPYNLRLGKKYSESSILINKFENFTQYEKQKFIICKLNSIVNYAQNNFRFYQNLYGKSPIKITKLSDFQDLPIITKKDVRKFTSTCHGTILLNTGGTSGEPLSFFVDKYAWAREWAHMHYIWGMKGYRHTDLMITMLGKDLNDKYYQYNLVHNEIKINPYKNPTNHISTILYLFKNYPIRYFQGYPSSIYNFLKYLEKNLSDDQIKLISKKINCCFLSSEYPLPYMTRYLKNTWKLDYISWYGHSEMCILAYDKNSLGEYTPLQTYGFTEEVNNTLIGTSYNNFDMPLIRYSTGDSINSLLDDYGFIKNFKIDKGREGDFVIDRDNTSIPLTSLVFGRHHKIFEIANFVQIYHPKRGEITFFITLSNSNKLDILDIENCFDLYNLNFHFEFKIINKPILTKSGKYQTMILNKPDIY